MKKDSKKRYTIKIILSYLVLAALAITAGYFIYGEVKGFLNEDIADDIDRKLIKTGTLVTELYQAESLSKLALQSGNQNNFDAYAAKIDSLVLDIEALKQLSASAIQLNLLDSVQVLLKQKVANSNELRNLDREAEANTAIDKALKEFKKMESSFGKLSIYTFEPNPEKLSSYERKVLQDWVDYLNENIPDERTAISDSEKIDSVLTASRALLAQVKRIDNKTQRFLATKEKAINENDLQLSQKLQTIISALEQEVILKSYDQNIERKAVLQRSMRLAVGTAILGFLIVALFTFLINRDFWRIQTYRDQLEKEKRFSESLLKSREQLISTVCHDLRTPLNTITGYAELLEGTSLSQKQAQYLKSVKSSSGYVGNLVNDLLDYSKLEAGKLHVEQIPFNVANLIQETAENLYELHSDKSLKLYLEIEESLQKNILGDPFRIKQILVNLIGNAFKFTDEGFVRIVAKAVKKGSLLKAEIAIQDTGKGIPKEQQANIFKEFVQADETIEKKFGGYGLGLTISMKIAKLLQGSLNVQSEVGTGSVFSLQLPLQISKKAITKKTKGQYLNKKLRILIIDDDTALLAMLKEMMLSMGISAHIFPNFLKVEKDTHLDYDLVLTDIQMPQITGFDVLKRLKSGTYTHYKKQPIIAMTGRRDLEMDAYTKVGFNHIIQKPFSKKEFLAMLGLLGLAENIKIEQKEIIQTPKKVNAIYSLDLIKSFLGENTEAINDVLRTFISDTDANMLALSKAIAQHNYIDVNKISHRMLPMFRQMKVSCVPILERMEQALPKTMSPAELNSSLKELQLKTTLLITSLEQEFATSSTYND